jgi:periplasmic protein TonB
MTDGVTLRTDALRVVQGDGRGDSLAAVVPARMRQPLPATVTATLGNVIPFLRPRATEVHAPDVVLPTDVARLPAAALARERLRHAGFVVASIVLHGAIFAYFVLREPEPLRSIGIEAISAEIVLGANQQAGLQPSQGEQNVTANKTDPQAVDPQREVERKVTEQAQRVEVAREESSPEMTTTLERQADEHQPQDNAAAPREQPAQAEPKYSVAMAENPNNPDTATATPKELPPDTTETSLLPQPDEKPVEKPSEPVQAAPQPVEKKPDPTPQKAAPPKPVKDAKPAKEPRRVDAPTREKATKQAKGDQSDFARKQSSQGLGPGRSDSNTNYSGLVSAHLRRHQQYPSDARSRGDQGVATVGFSLDGSGRVTSARLVRGSGIASIDQEVQAMVRRASPFPAPPGGRGQSFTVPVRFGLH